jgi:glyceraldehyde 3-phosphate dehydrogenase
MSIKLAINGFGRIGRLAFRQVFDDSEFEVVAINDLTSADLLAYLLKHDSSQGGYLGHTVENDDSSITVDGKNIKIYKEPDPSKLPWGQLGVDVVLECTGFFTSKAKSQAHIAAGAKKVLISAPAGNDLPTIVYGTNHEILKKDDLIVSGASCTTNCLAPMAKALNDYREVRTGFMTTIHAYTGDQMILDGPQKKGDFRRSRAGAINIVPTSSGAAKAIGLVIPELDGKLIGSAQRVPVASGSITILDATLKDMTDSVSVEGINAIMKAEATESFGYTEEQIVSSDVIGMHYGSLFDATQTLAQQCGTHIFEVRVVSWYDNEMSYTTQLVRTLRYMAKLA